MSKQKGRPFSENPLSHEIKVRIDTRTNAKLLKYCNSNNVTKAELIRSLLVDFLEKES